MRAGRPEGWGVGGWYQKSSQLLFHLLALLDGPLGTQATPPFSVTEAPSTQVGPYPPTAHAVTGRPTASPESPPCLTSSGEEESLEIKQANTEPASSQGLSWSIGHSSHLLPGHQAVV